MSNFTLESIELGGYKSINHGLVELSDVSVLIGKNNSGKSNVIGAFSDLKYINDDSRPQLDGWVKKFTGRDTDNEMNLSLVYSLPDRYRTEVIDNIDRTSPRQSRNFRNQIEEGSALTKIKYSVNIEGTRRRDRNQTFHIDIEGGWLEFNNVRGEFGININRSEIRDEISDSMQTWQFVSPFRVPDDTGHARELTDLDPDGENLVQVLNALESDYSDIFEDISSAYVDIMDGVSDMTVEFSQGSEKTIKIKEEGYDIKFSAEDISSGSKEILVLLTQVYLASKNSDVLFLEEPELHLHPDAERKVFDIIQEIAASTSTQFVIATHSDVFVNQSETSSITRVAKDGDTKLKSIDPEDVHVELQDLGYSKSGLLQSEAVVFVEGISDKLILSEWASTLDLNLNEVGISIVELEGEGNIGTHGRSLVKLLQSFDIPYLFIIDSDNDDPYDAINHYKRKINREDADDIDDDLIWWHTTPENFEAWSDSDIEYFLLESPNVIADVIGEDIETVTSIIDASDADKNVNVLKEIWDECMSDPHGITSYEKVHGKMIAKNMSRSDIDEEIVEVVDRMRDLV